MKEQLKKNYYYSLDVKTNKYTPKPTRTVTTTKPLLNRWDKKVTNDWETFNKVLKCFLL